MKQNDIDMEHMMEVGDLVKRRIYSLSQDADDDLFLVVKVIRQGVRESVKLWKINEALVENPYERPLSSSFFEKVS
jgi:hypothetical protein